MIENLTYRGKTLVLSSPESRALKSILKIDSFTLLIGINGSGKTTLLINAATVLTQGAKYGDQGCYLVLGTDNESRPYDTRYAPPGYGVVYYTALPYRKSLRTRGRLVNASPSRTSARDNKSIELLREVAGGLNTKARLVARVTYHRDFAHRLLVPALLESDVHFRDIHLQVLHSALLESQYTLLRREFLGQDSKNTINPSIVKKWRDTLDQFEHHLSVAVCNALDQHGTFFRAASLASLEAAFERFEQPERLAIFMLHDCDVVHDELLWRRDGGDFTAIRDATIRYLTNENGDIRRMNREDPGWIDFEITTDTEYARLLVEDTAIQLDWQGLSSGMLALVEQFARIDHAIWRLKKKKVLKVLLFIDEGDAFLHLEWQRKYIDMLNEFLGVCATKHGLESLQVVLATHSPILAGDLPSSMIQSLDEKPRDFKTFGSTLDDIVLSSFQSNSIGEFAAKHIRRLHVSVIQGTLNEADRLLLDEIGDPVLKKEVLSTTRPNHDR